MRPICESRFLSRPSIYLWKRNPTLAVYPTFKDSKRRSAEVIQRKAWVAGARNLEKTDYGVFYATLRRKLVSSHGWEGVDACWSPIYPVLVRLSSLIFKDLEFSGRMVSAIMGSLLIIPAIFLIRKFSMKKLPNFLLSR